MTALATRGASWRRLSITALATRSLMEALVDGGLGDEESLVEEFVDDGLGDGEDNGGPAAWAAPVAGCAWSTICLRISLLLF